MARIFKLAPALALFSGMAALAQDAPAPNPDSNSPQQKIVRKYKLQEKVKLIEENEDAFGNEGCRQPSSQGDERAMYKDFRTVVSRADNPDSLLFVCTTTEGLPEGVENIFTETKGKVTFVTPGVAKLPQKQRRSLFGHEGTHVVNGDEPLEPTQEIADFFGFERQLASEIRLRNLGGRPVTLEELQPVVVEENRLRLRMVNAIIAAAEHNHPLELTADRGGLILAAGSGCKIDPEPMIAGLQALYDTMPKELSEGTYSHPRFTERKDDMRNDKTELVTACRDYYRARKQNRHHVKRPGPG